MLQTDIFFYHIMKTAGTTVVRLLEEAFGPESMCSLPPHEGADETAFVARVADPSPAVVGGHPHQLFPLWELADRRRGR